MTTTNDTSTTAGKPARARRSKTAPADTAPAPTAPPPAPASPAKADTVIKLLFRAKGATPMELIAATDWQPHSLRAFLSGLRKKGRFIVREQRKNGDGVYRIVVAPTPAARVAEAEYGGSTEKVGEPAPPAADAVISTADA